MRKRKKACEDKQKDDFSAFEVVSDNNLCSSPFSHNWFLVFVVIAAALAVTAVCIFKELQGMNDDQLGIMNNKPHECQETQLNKDEINSKKETVSALIRERETLLEQLEVTKQGNTNSHHLYNNGHDVMIEQKDIIADLRNVVTTKEMEISLGETGMESLKKDVQRLALERETLSVDVQNLKIQLSQLTGLLGTKSEAVESLQLQNSKLVATLTSYRDETMRVIKDIEEQKEACLLESESQHLFLLDKISILEDKKKLLEDEKEICEEKYDLLEIKHEEKVSVLDHLEKQVSSLIELENQYPYKSMEGKMDLESSVNHIEMIMKDRTAKVEEMKLQLGDCKVKR